MLKATNPPETLPPPYDEWLEAGTHARSPLPRKVHQGVPQEVKKMPSLAKFPRQGQGSCQGSHMLTCCVCAGSQFHRLKRGLLQLSASGSDASVQLRFDLLRPGTKYDVACASAPREHTSFQIGHYFHELEAAGKQVTSADEKLSSVAVIARLEDGGFTPTTKMSGP